MSNNIYKDYSYDVLFKTPEYKSKLIVGNNTIYLTKKLNWFQRKMYRLFFNIIAENITAENKKEEK